MKNVMYDLSYLGKIFSDTNFIDFECGTEYLYKN